MQGITVFREIQGSFEHVGHIDAANDYLGPSFFSYSSGYLAQSDAAPISASLPLQDERADEQITDAFFDGLLSEGNTRLQVSRIAGVDPADTTGLLSVLNYDTIGALVFTNGDTPSYEQAAYDPIGFGLEDLDMRKASSLAEYAVRTHASLSGYVNKLGAYFGPDGNWYAPLGLAPSNFIIKLSDPELPFDVENELLCSAIARNLGLNAASCFGLKEAQQERAWAIAIKRYDRVCIEDKALSGLPLFGRLHQEDFCQALGFGAGLKYEHDGGSYFRRATALIKRCSSQPAVDINMFVDNLLLDYLLGNCDNHLKNYSLLYSEDWKHRQLAPSYDKLCTLYYPQYATNLGIPLSRSLLHERLTKEGLEQCMQDAGYSLRYAERRLGNILNAFDSACSEAVQELVDSGYVIPADLVECIKRSSGFVEKAIVA